MKKILIFTDSFLPGFKGGGPITSIANLVSLLNKDFNILICTKNHDFGDTEPYSEVVSDKMIRYKEYNVVYLSKMDKQSISKVIEEFNPDLLYLNSFFSKTTQIVMLLNRFIFKKRCIVAPRGELQENALNIKKTKKSIYLFIYKLFGLYKNIYFHATDKIETDRIKSLFSTDAVTQLQNAVKIQKFEPLVKKENELKIVFVSRILKNKNLLYALELLMEIKHKIVFDIYGPKENIEYWSRCQHMIDKLPSNIIATYKGSLVQSETIQKMRQYHCFLLPTITENFGHVIVEAMQAGLVPIISNQTPWKKLNEVNAGWDLPLNDKEGYKQVLEALYVMNSKDYTQKSLAVMSYIHKKLDMEELKYKYIDLFS